MHEQGLIDRPAFSLCLGKNGGVVTFGGHNESLHVNDSETFSEPLIRSSMFRIALNDVSVGGKKLAHGKSYRTAFIDSGTTFTYIPYQMSVDLEKSFDAFCSRNVSCLGRRDRGLCYWMDTAIFAGREKHFFASFPVIALHTSGGNALRWYPSEYFYAAESKDSHKLYCMAKENYGRSTELLLGGSFMR